MFPKSHAIYVALKNDSKSIPNNGTSLEARAQKLSNTAP